nr:hypothetical protein [Candidatus Thorarchaeota archaeon]
QKLKAELKSKLEAIEKDRNTLEEGIQILREKAVIRELEEKVREEQDAVSRLSFEKRELEDELKQPSRFEISETVEKTKAELEDKKDKFGTEAKEQPETEKTEQTRAIWKKPEETSESDKEPEETSESDKEHEEQESKKKLRFF